MNDAIGRRRSGLALRLTVPALALALAVAACTGDDDDRAADPDSAPDPVDVPEPGGESVRLAAINVLHGLFCPEETDFCDAPARLDLLDRQIEDAGCPDVVGLAEIGPRQEELVPERLDDLCDGRYELLWDPEGQGQTLDQEMILTSLEVVDDAYVDLANFPWGAHWVRVESPIGAVDFVTTHFASSANNPPCTAETCPPTCPEGIETGTCHSLQIVDFLDGIAEPDTIQVVSNDLNATIDSDRLAPLLDAGFVDAWIEAGLPECDPATGEGCTCCIGSEVDDYDGGGLDDPAGQRTSRIDFVLVRGTPDCTPGFAASDTDLLGGDPVDPPFEGLLWPSDHAGVVTTLTCA